MSRHMREQVRWGLIVSLAGAATWAGVGCSSSSAPQGSSVACDPSSGDCRDDGETCTTDLECGSGSCAQGACAVVPETGGGGGGGGLGEGNGGSYGFFDDLDPQGGSGGEEESCVDLDVDFARVTPTVVLLIDQSGSMLQSFENSVNRWQTLRNTLTDPENSIIKKLDTSVRFGMSLYTSNGGFGDDQPPKECPVLKNVDIALGSFADMVDMLEDNGPAGDTPTAESVAVVAQRLEAFAEEGPKSIILATDGDPDTCEDPNANDDAGSKTQSVAAVTAAYADGIATHVISVGNQVTAQHLKDLAVAGAGGDPDAEAYTALDTTALVDAFNQIIGAVRTCDFTLEGN